MVDNETLDEVCRLITGSDDALFGSVRSPEQRVEILKLAIAIEANEKVAKTNEVLDLIDDRLAVISNWFDKSKVYWP